MPDGSVRWGYHAEKIRERKTFRPHASNVFEYPEYHRRGATDPGGMPALDLSVPELGAEEAERARLWRKVDAVRAALNVPMDADPAEVLEQVRSLLAA